MQQPNNSTTYLLGQLSTTKPVLRRLRAVIPTHDCSVSELLRILDLQAGLLAMVSYEAGLAEPYDLVRGLPSLRIRDTDLPVSGFSYWDGHRWVVNLHIHEAPERRRFTLLHEFAHIVWHGAELQLFPGVTIGGRAHLAELAANYFAGAVLLPRHLVLHAWHGGTHDVDELATRFDVSIETLIVRLAQLGLISGQDIATPFLRPDLPSSRPPTTPNRKEAPMPSSITLEPESQLPSLLTVREACAYLRVSRWMFYRLLQSRQLATITIGTRRLVTRVALDQYVLTQQQLEDAK